MKLQDIVKNIVQDTAVDLTQEFDRNFERKAFFDRKWPSEKYANSRGSQMMRSGKLRRSVQNNVSGGIIKWSSSLPYASMHNEGGEVVVTEKMKKFFWAMFYKNNNAVVYNIKKKAKANTARNRKLNGEAAKWKSMALLKVGTKLEIDQRQFIGWHPQVDRSIAMITNDNMKDYDKYLQDKLKQ